MRSQEAVKAHPLFVAQATSLAWHVKEQAGHAAALRDATDAFSQANDAARAEREVRVCKRSGKQPRVLTCRWGTAHGPVAQGV